MFVQLITKNAVKIVTKNAFKPKTECRRLIVYCERDIFLAQRCVCKVNFTLDNDYEADVKIYYGMRHFQLNHRRMLQSRDDKQLRGSDVTSPKKKLCFPLYSAYDSVASMYNCSQAKLATNIQAFHFMRFFCLIVFLFD